MSRISLYSRPLKAYEIRALYNAGPAGKSKADQPPIEPLSLQLTCASLASYIHRCSAAVSGGWQPYSYSWSYTGNGSVNPAGSLATIEMSGCPSFGKIQVTVTDAAGATRTAGQNLSCSSSTCTGSKICLPGDLE